MLLAQANADQIIDTLRECRVILRNQDALDDDIAAEVIESLEILGVDDPEES